MEQIEKESRLLIKNLIKNNMLFDINEGIDNFFNRFDNIIFEERKDFRQKDFVIRYLRNVDEPMILKGSKVQERIKNKGKIKIVSKEKHSIATLKACLLICLSKNNVNYQGLTFEPLELFFRTKISRHWNELVELNQFYKNEKEKLGDNFKEEEFWKTKDMFFVPEYKGIEYDVPFLDKIKNSKKEDEKNNVTKIEIVLKNTNDEIKELMQDVTIEEETKIEETKIETIEEPQIETKEEEKEETLEEIVERLEREKEKKEEETKTDLLKGLEDELEEIKEDDIFLEPIKIDVSGFYKEKDWIF
ncbi:MAG: hypothetical protein ACRC4M_04165 [Mycoplasma sp.]